MASEFGSVLAHLRTARGLAQTKLAWRADFDHSYVSRLEAGHRMPTRDAVDRLARAMDATPPERDALLEAAGFLGGRSLDLSTIVHALDELRHEVALLRRELAVRDAA
jgi:transcriptional regulator with XRE-family HTH domain